MIALVVRYSSRFLEVLLNDGKKRHWIAIVCCFGAVLSYDTTLYGAQQPQSLLPDLAFHFVCKGRERAQIEGKVEAFLAQHNFKVLNQGELQRQHEVHLFNTSISAYEGDLRFVEVRSVPSAADRYSFGLYSLPPTNHARGLEENSLNFVSQNLGCEMRQVERNENDETHADFFRKLLGMMRNLFEEADQIRGLRKI